MHYEKQTQLNQQFTKSQRLQQNVMNSTIRMNSQSSSHSNNIYMYNNSLSMTQLLRCTRYMCECVFHRLLDSRFEPYRVGKSREARPKIVSLRTDSQVKLTEQQLNRGVGSRCLTKRVLVLSSKIVVAMVIACCYSCSNGF